MYNCNNLPEDTAVARNFIPFSLLAVIGVISNVYASCKSIPMITISARTPLGSKVIVYVT